MVMIIMGLDFSVIVCVRDALYSAMNAKLRCGSF